VIFRLAYAQICGPDVKVYEIVGTTNLTAHILRPQASKRSNRASRHVNKDLPPTAIFVGGADTLTPARWTKRFRDLMNEHGGYCEIQIYPPRLPEDR